MSGASPPRDVKRISALDGLRGWAALSVVIFHLGWELFGGRFPIYHSVWVALPGTGPLAVAIFFVISGYVLTIGRWRRTDNPPLLLTLVRRYLRLEIPIIVTVLIVFALMALRLTPTVEAAAIVKSAGWLGTFANFAPNGWDALAYAVIRVFFERPPQNYVPFLWTMLIELWCSAFVLILSHRTPRYGLAYLILLGYIVYCYFRWQLALPFPLGALVALLQRDGWLFRDPPTRLESFIASTAIIAILGAAAELRFVFSSQPASNIAGVALFLAVMRSLPARAVLETRPSQALGRMSFPLYLVQYPLIVSVGAGTVIALEHSRALTPWTALFVLVAMTMLILFAALAFMPVERFTLRLIKRIGRSSRTQPATV